MKLSLPLSFAGISLDNPAVGNKIPPESYILATLVPTEQQWECLWVVLQVGQVNSNKEPVNSLYLHAGLAEIDIPLIIEKK